MGLHSSVAITSNLFLHRSLRLPVHGVLQVIRMRFTLNVLISCPLKLPRLDTFDFNSFAVIRARAARRNVSLLHSETNEELHKEKFLIRLMHTEYLSFPN